MKVKKVRTREEILAALKAAEEEEGRKGLVEKFLKEEKDGKKE